MSLLSEHRAEAAGPAVLKQSDCVGYFPVTVTKHLTEATLGRRGFSCSGFGVQTMTVGNLWGRSTRPQCTAVRMQREPKAGRQPTLSFLRTL